MLDAFTLIAGALPSQALRVLAFTGREAVSRCYRFRIDVAVSESLAPDLEDELLGERAVFDLGPVADARVIAGIVRRVEVREALAHDLRAARVELVPRLFRLSLRVTSRIFQDKTVPEIVTAVLEQAGVPHRSALAAKYARRSYCVQHQESDLAFVTRLLAEEGILVLVRPRRAGQGGRGRDRGAVGQRRPVPADCRRPQARLQGAGLGGAPPRGAPRLRPARGTDARLRRGALP